MLYNYTVLGSAGSVWIFQIQFGSVQFLISGTGFGFFSFGFCTSPQWRHTQWVKRPLKSADCTHYPEQKAAAFVLRSHLVM